MAIKDNAAFADLKPYLAMTVSPNGVTVGDLNFVVAQTQWSTTLITPSAANTLPADINADLFQTAQGDVGQGFTTGLTRSQTSWEDSQGRLPANQVFVATSCGFQIFKTDTASTVATATEQLIPSQHAVNAIGSYLSWEVTVGDGITRNYGDIGSFGGYGGAWSSAPVETGAVVTGSALAMLGDPCCKGRNLPIPLVFPPNISVRIKLKSGTALNVGGIALAALNDIIAVGEKLVVRQYLHGYLCTMPVA